MPVLFKLIDVRILPLSKDRQHKSWKQLAEQISNFGSLETTSSTPAFEKDKESLSNLFGVFSSSSLSRYLSRKVEWRILIKAIEDNANCSLNTGTKHCDGSILEKQADGKSSVQNSWRKSYTITDMLTAIRRRLKIAKRKKPGSTYGMKRR